MKQSVIIVTFLLLSNFHLYGQKYVLENENIIYSFQTNNGKIMTLCSEKNGHYIVYRFGTKNSIELEYPNSKDTSSWSKFEYSNYLRGGGIQNEGIDLNYVAFTVEKTKYVIFDNYFSLNEKYEIGIKVIDLSNNKTIKISGNKQTQKGALINLRFDKLIKQSEVLYH